MSEIEDEKYLGFQNVTVKCPHCGANWVTSMLVDWCNCLQCEQKLIPKLHIVVESENEVN